MDVKAIFDRLIDESPDTKEKLFVAAVYLFSEKGFDRVGIRELASAVGIKESSVYNHYAGKDAILSEILTRFWTILDRAAPTPEEAAARAAEAGVDEFLGWLNGRMTAGVGNPLYYAMFRISRAMSFYSLEAARTMLRNPYRLWGSCAEAGLRALRDAGRVRGADMRRVVAEYYYGLMGILEEYLLRERWGEDLSEIGRMVVEHAEFYADYLRAGKEEES